MTTRLEPLVKTARTDAERLVARAAEVPPATVDLAAWDELVAVAATRPRRDWRLVPAFLASVAAGVVLVTGAFPGRAPVEVVELVVSADTRWSHEQAGVVRLTAGQLRVGRAAGRKVRVETPHVVLEATRSRFLAEVVASGTSLLVEEGEVTVRAGGQVRVVRAGEALVWPPLPEIPAALLEEHALAARCVGPDVVARRACLEAEALGATLEAQAALFELGALESTAGHSARAVAAWEASLARFPDGVLHPEVRLKLLVELVRARRFADASSVAAQFEQECAGDARLEDVRALAATLRARQP